MCELTRLMDNLDVNKDLTVDKEPHLSNSNSGIHHNTINMLNLNNSSEPLFNVSQSQLRNDEKTPNFNNYSYIPHEKEHKQFSNNFVLKNLSSHFIGDDEEEKRVYEEERLSNTEFENSFKNEKLLNGKDGEVFENNILKILEEEDEMMSNGDV